MVDIAGVGRYGGGMKPLRNSLLIERRARGLTRQSYAAIESGASIPSTEVALRLARFLGRGVESLFELTDGTPGTVAARWVGVGKPVGRRARLYRVGGELLAHAIGEGDVMNRMADGTVTGYERDRVSVAVLPDRPEPPSLAIVGCDPAIGVVAEALRRARSIEITWLQRGSLPALEALAAGAAHVAGVHLRDAVTGEFNSRAIRENIPFPCTRVSFAWWEQGLLVPAGNPHSIRGVADLVEAGVRFLNREVGSGSRALFDDHLADAGIPAEHIPGYASVAPGHMAVAQAIAAGLADAGIGIRAAAHAYGLDLVTLGSERYDLVIPNHFLDLPAVQALLDTLRAAGVRAQVEALGGYDTSVMGREC
jgi:putative molybdopterin biosynthesis protein